MAERSHQPTKATTKLLLSLLAGILLALLVTLFGSAKFAPLGGWDTAALLYVVWTWLEIQPMDAANTKSHAIMEDPGRAGADVLLLCASVGSLIAVGILIMQASNSTGSARIIEVTLGLFSVIASWLVVQTIHTLKYASLYYGKIQGGIDFNQNDPPRYSDFAYLSFTMGMTFQVSDTALQTPEIRATALKHALLSYVFGTVIIATTINTIASLGK